MVYHKLFSAQGTEEAFRWKASRPLRLESSDLPHDTPSVTPPFTPSRPRVRTVTIFSSPSKLLLTNQNESAGTLGASPLCYETAPIIDSESQPTTPMPTFPGKPTASQSLSRDDSPPLSAASLSSRNSAQPAPPPADRDVASHEPVAPPQTAAVSSLPLPPTSSPCANVPHCDEVIPMHHPRQSLESMGQAPPTTPVLTPVEPVPTPSTTAVVQAAPGPSLTLPTERAVTPLPEPIQAPPSRTPLTERALSPLSEPPCTPPPICDVVPMAPVLASDDRTAVRRQKRTAAMAGNSSDDQPAKRKKASVAPNPRIATQPSPRRLRSQKAPVSKAARVKSGTAVSKRK